MTGHNGVVEVLRGFDSRFHSHDQARMNHLLRLHCGVVNKPP